MSEKKDYDSVLVGWTDEPRVNDGEFSSISFRLKDSDLKEALDSYVSQPDAEGKGGGYVKFTCFKSKSGKYFTRILNPNSKQYKDYKGSKAAESSSGEDLPF
jgi:hypothetical protein